MCFFAEVGPTCLIAEVGPTRLWSLLLVLVCCGGAAIALVVLVVLHFRDGFHPVHVLCASADKLGLPCTQEAYSKDL